MKNYNIIKVSRDNTELLETMKAESITAARKAAVVKYMNIVLSTQTQLVIEEE